MTEEEAISEAWKRYPAGSVFDSLGGFKNVRMHTDCTIRACKRNGVVSDLSVYNGDRGYIGSLYRYRNGEHFWAKRKDKGAQESCIVESYSIY